MKDYRTEEEWKKTKKDLKKKINDFNYLLPITNQKKEDMYGEKIIVSSKEQEDAINNALSIAEELIFLLKQWLEQGEKNE